MCGESDEVHEDGTEGGYGEGSEVDKGDEDGEGGEDDEGDAASSQPSPYACPYHLHYATLTSFTTSPHDPHLPHHTALISPPQHESHLP